MRIRVLKAALTISLLASALVFAPAGVAAAAPATATALSPSRRWIGFYQPGAPLYIDMLAQTEWSTRSRARCVSYYESSHYQGIARGFNTSLAEKARAHGVVPLITLELWNPSAGLNQPSFSMSAIKSGSQDAFLRKYAQGAKAYGGEVWLRPFHEMNGNWYPWGGTVNGNTPQLCKEAWQHMHDIFVQEGATNVKFVWSPNIEGVPGYNAKSIPSYWPGEAYVDVICLDGFNFGPGDRMEWRSFQDLFDTPYDTVAKLSATRPIIVGEVGCATKGGDKAKWISDMFRVIPSRFPRIVGVVWFNQKKDRDWRAESSSSSLSAFVAGAQTYHWINKKTTSLSIKTSKKTTKRRRAFTLSGYLKPGRTGDQVRVYVRKPGSSVYKLSSTRKVTGTFWRYSFKPGLRGTYRFKVRYLGDFSRRTATSPTIKVVVR